MTTKNWTAMDAGEMREALAEEMAAWLAAGFFPTARAERFHRRAKRVAGLAGFTADQVYRDIRTDALAILVDQGVEPANP